MKPLKSWKPVGTGLVRGAILAAVVLPSAGCGGADTVEVGGLPEFTPLTTEQTLVVGGDRSVRVVDAAGVQVRRIGNLDLPEGAEVDAVDVTGDGTRALVSVLNDHDDACEATVFAVTDTGFERVADGAAASFAPDGTRFAHLTYRADDEFCMRSRLVVRDTASGRVVADVPLPGGEVLEGTPPAWPLS